LAETLCLGEGSIRTILNKMAREEAIENNREGATLTERGRRRLHNLGIEVGPVEISIGIHGKYCAALVRSADQYIKNGREQRDAAVRAGAEGAIILTVKDDNLIFPGDNYPLDQFNTESVRSTFVLGKGDVVIIGFAPSYNDAEKGAVTAALTVDDSPTGCWNIGAGIINSNTEANELECLALAMHELVGRMPLGMRSKNKLGVRCEDGRVIDRQYTGPNLEEALVTGKVVRKVATSGPYMGAPIVAVPIFKDKETIAVIGLVDFTQLSIYDIMGRIRKTDISNIYYR